MFFSNFIVVNNRKVYKVNIYPNLKANKMNAKQKIYLVGIGMGTALGFTLGLGYHVISSKTIPNQSQVQQGFVAPSKLEIFCEDLDHNGKSETYMKVGEDRYLLREVEGKPTLSAYEFKPAEVVPRE